MEAVVAILAILGGLIPIGAILIAGRRLRGELKKLQSALDEIDRIIFDPTLSDKEKTDRMSDVLAPEFTHGRLTYTFEWIKRLIFENALRDLYGPAIWTMVGVLIATVASVWSIWV